MPQQPDKKTNCCKRRTAEDQACELLCTQRGVIIRFALIGKLMKTTILRWSSVSAAALSAAWIILISALVVRCKLSGQPFPVLAKFSPFREHLKLTDRCLRMFPVFAFLALALAGAAWYSERTFRSVRTVAIASALIVLLSLLVIVLNPGGCVSWFLS